MAVELAVGTPLADALQSVLQPKLAEVGWSGEDETTLSEYIILMLANGKTQDQIASEISNDLLGLGPGDPAAIEFSRWLFEQVEVLNARLNGAQAVPQTSAPSQAAAPPSAMEGTTQDADMGDASAATM